MNQRAIIIRPLRGLRISRKETRHGSSLDTASSFSSRVDIPEIMVGYDPPALEGWMKANKPLAEIQ